MLNVIILLNGKFACCLFEEGKISFLFFILKNSETILADQRCPCTDEDYFCNYCYEPNPNGHCRKFFISFIE